MNYLKIHDQIIDRAKSENRIKLEKDDINYKYYERHHILPKCLGGFDSVDNFINLTAREHFLIHWLLCRIYPERSKLAHAFWKMCFGNSRKKEINDNFKPSSRAYSEAKELRMKSFYYKIRIYNYLTYDFVGEYENLKDIENKLQLNINRVARFINNSKKAFGLYFVKSINGIFPTNEEVIEEIIKSKQEFEKRIKLNKISFKEKKPLKKRTKILLYSYPNYDYIGIFNIMPEICNFIGINNIRSTSFTKFNNLGFDVLRVNKNIAENEIENYKKDRFYK